MQEVQIISQSLGQLQDAQERFVQNISTLTSLKVIPAGILWNLWESCCRVDQDLMVPLTSSVYVSGTLEAPGRVLVDVGTGYYLEKVSRCFLYSLHIWLQFIGPWGG